MDENLPWRLCACLSKLGHEARHVSEIGLAGKPDPEVNLRALSEGACIITRDADFTDLPARRSARVVRLKVGNCSTPALIARFEALWPEIETRLLAGDQLVEAG